MPVIWHLVIQVQTQHSFRSFPPQGVEALTKVHTGGDQEVTAALPLLETRP